MFVLFIFTLRRLDLQPHDNDQGHFPISTRTFCIQLIQLLTTKFVAKVHAHFIREPSSTPLVGEVKK